MCRTGAAAAAVFCSFHILSIGTIRAFNLSPVPNFVFPEARQPPPAVGARSSYFGYSIVLRETSIIIGAPRANSTSPAQLAIAEPGAVFKCTFPDDARPACAPYLFDVEGNVESKDLAAARTKNHQWLGATMDGGPSDNDSLVVCAPRLSGGSVDQHMHGICYWTKNTVGQRPDLAPNWNISLLTHQKRQMSRHTDNVMYEYLLGLQGFSLRIMPNNLEVLMGAPSVFTGQGTAIRFFLKDSRRNIPRIEKHFYSYAGYAVAGGYLDSRNTSRLLYLATVPQNKLWSMLGKAYIFDYIDMNRAKILSLLKGDQYGEYFGYSALVEDVNGDGLADILISAPMFSLDAAVDVGAVYEFLNDKSLHFQRKRIESPFRAFGRFGTTIAPLGDINLDGYNDVAIGAPFAGDHGVVAIHLGGPRGLQQQPSQILKPTNVAAAPNGMFGHGLSKGVDIDGNGYNDFAVGAPNADAVFLYKAYPVVRVVTAIQPDPQQLALGEEDLLIEICFGIATNSTLISGTPVLLTVELDPTLRRAELVDFGGHRAEFNVTASVARECRGLNAKVKYYSSHVFKPIRMSLSHKLWLNGTAHSEQRFCDDCVVVDPSQPTVSSSLASYYHGCQREVCQVNLKVILVRAPSNVILGSANVVNTRYFLENLGEKAFDTRLSITAVPGLPFAKIPPNCEAQHTSLVCHVGEGHEFTGSTELLQAQNVTITAVASSTGYELSRKDNTFEHEIAFLKHSSIEIVGTTNEQFITGEQLANRTEIVHSFKLENHGPSTVCDLEVVLTLPVGHRDTKRNTVLHFVNLTSLQLRAEMEGYSLPDLNFDALDEPAAGTSPNREGGHRANSSIGSYDLPQERTYVMDCSTRTNVTCITSRLLYRHFAPGQNLTLVLKYVFNATTLAAAVGQQYEYLSIQSDLNVRLQSAEATERELSVTKVIEPLVIVKSMKARTPLWVYPVGALTGLLLLALLVTLLRKYGFFKRKTAKDMEEMLQHKIEVARMKEAIEQAGQSVYE